MTQQSAPRRLKRSGRLCLTTAMATAGLALNACDQAVEWDRGAAVASEPAPAFAYRAVDASGIVEHERCPVFVGRIVGDPQPDPDEVVEWRWTEPERLRTAIAAAPWAFSPWLVLQAEQLPLLAGAA